MNLSARWTLAAMAALHLSCAHAPTPAPTGSARAIRQTRAAFNAAIEKRDPNAIVAFFLPTYHVVSARSAQRHGRDESLRNWVEMFAADPSVRYVRTPGEIQVNEEWGMAQEVGTWSGTLRASDGPVSVSGVYAAKWQRTTAGTWLLQAEVFTPLSCRGGPKGCVPPDPVGN